MWRFSGLSTNSVVANQLWIENWPRCDAGMCENPLANKSINWNFPNQYKRHYTILRRFICLPCHPSRSACVCVWSGGSLAWDLIEIATSSSITVRISPLLISRTDGIVVPRIRCEMIASTPTLPPYLLAHFTVCWIWIWNLRYFPVHILWKAWNLPGS